MIQLHRDTNTNQPHKPLYQTHKVQFPVNVENIKNYLLKGVKIDTLLCDYDEFVLPDCLIVIDFLYLLCFNKNC